MRTVRLPTHLLSIGKAGVEMARAAIGELGPLPGIVAGPPERVGSWTDPPEGLTLFATDHPTPSERNTHAARCVLAFCEALNERDRLLVLVSGGASAQLALPVDSVSLGEVARLQGHLMRAGATIDELNSVRKRLDRIKGGRLGVAAWPAACDVLVLSDVLGDRLDVVSSGPMHPDRSTRADALAVLDRFNAADLPAARAIIEGGEQAEPPPPDHPAFARIHHRVIGNHESLARAASEALSSDGFLVEARTMVSGVASEIGQALGERLARLEPAHAVVWAGETTVAGVPEGARGGPAMESGLAAALALDHTRAWTILAYASDGIDGPTDAAGAVITQAQLDDPAGARRALAAHDVYPYLDSLGGLIRTGPTGTNLNDVLIGWRDS